MRKGCVVIIILLIGLLASAGSLISTENVTHVNTPSITVVYPNEGERWEQGKTYTIEWTSRYVRNVTIELEKNNYEGWYLVYTAPSSPGGGKFNITVVNDFGGGGDYKVNIWDTNDPGIADSSDNYFIIMRSPNSNITLVGVLQAEIPNIFATNDLEANSTIGLNHGLYFTPDCISSPRGDNCMGMYISAREIAFGDLNGDNIPDAVAISDEYWGGAGESGETLWVWTNDFGRPKYLAQTPIGYRPIINSINIINSTITVDMYPYPAQNWTREVVSYKLDRGQLVKMAP